MKISPARIASFEILTRIEREKSFSSALLPIYEENLTPKDRGLCHELTLGTLRKQLFLDKIIEQFVTKKLDLEVKVALRLAIYQIRFLDRIPVYSAINESVNLVQRAKKTSAKGLVNAVLRRISESPIAFNYSNQIEEISIENSHPIWLIEKWISQFGVEETAKLAVTNNETPDLQFRPTAGFGKEQRGEDRGALVELAAKGEIYFQDKASQMVAEVVELAQNEKFLDVCCAPASKLSMIAASVQNKTVFGGDYYFQRLQTAKKNCQRQGLKNVKFIQYDATKTLPIAESSIDVVLVDAPCSGTGTIRHNPEIRYFLQPNDFSELSAKQLKILSNASKLIKRGGRLIYSTCSLEIEENEQVIELFLSQNQDFSIVQPKMLTQYLTEKGFARTFPHRDKMDGFFIAILKKL